MDPHPDFGSDVEIDAHTQRLWKVIYLCHSGPSGRAGQASPAGKGDRLAWSFYCGKRTGGGVRVPSVGRGLCGLNLPQTPKERAPRLHSQLAFPDVGQQGEERDEA